MIIGLSEAANQSAKFLKRMTQEQVDQLACIAPKCDLAHNRWGDCSLWVVSVANRALKAGQFTVDQILQFKDEIGLDLQAFTEYKAELGGNIDAFKSYKDLHHAVEKYIEGGRVVPKVSGAQMSNRARTAYHRMKAEGFDVVYEDRTWLVASPTGFDANETMSPIGKWCHTGAVGGNGLKYWNDYSIGPIYYILNKREGYVLCHSYAASYEIEDQTDKRPYRLEAGSNVWGFNSGKEQSDRPPKAVPYGDSETDWNDFMDYIDPAGNVKAAILKYERGYEQTLQKRLEAAVENEMIAPLEKSIDDGVLTLNSGNVQALYRLLHKADVDFPDEDDYEDEDDYNTDYEAAQAADDAEYDKYQKYIAGSAEEFLDGIKVIRLDPSEKRADLIHGTSVFSHMTYDGALPTIDMAGKNGGSVTSMFAGSNIKVAPDVINAEGVEHAGQMFENCTQLEHVGKVQLPSATSANRMFARCSRLKSIEKLDLRSCVQTNLLFSGASAGKTLSIGELVLSPEGDPFKVFCQDQSAWSGVQIGKLDTGPDDTLYDRLRSSTQNGTREPGGQWLYGNYYSAVANSIRRSMSAPLRTLVGKIKRDVFAEFDFNGQDVIIKDEKFNRLITLYQDSFGSYDMTAFGGTEKLFADTVADLMQSADVAGGTRIVISDSQFEALPHASLVSFFVKPSKPGAVYVRYGENDVRQPNKDDVQRRLYSLEHPDGMVTFTDNRDRDPSIMRKFVKAIYDDAGNMVVKGAAVDITGFYDNADKRENLWLMLQNYVPHNAKDLPVIKLTGKQKSYRNGGWVFVRTGEDDYDKDWEGDDLFEHHPALAERYGKDGQTCDRFVVTDKGGSELDEWERIGRKLR